MKRKAIGYIRVSTAGQADEGVSLDSQREKIRAWCDLHGHALHEVRADEGLSGKRADNRPALQAALNEVCACKGILVVWSLDRLARSTRDAIDIVSRLGKADADLAILTMSIDTSTAVGEFFFTIMAGLAQLERKQIGERTRTALAHKKGCREVYAPIPLGFDRVGERLVPNRSEQETVELIRQLRARKWSYGRIAKRLNSDGAKTKRGGKWHASTVRYVCVNPLYAEASTVEKD